MKEDILYLIETLNMTNRQTYQTRLTDGHIQKDIPHKTETQTDRCSRMRPDRETDTRKRKYIP